MELVDAIDSKSVVPWDVSVQVGPEAPFSFFLMIDTYKALILAIIEGFTEFLPISSTAHLLFAAKILDFTSIPNHSFEIIIQLAAILPLFIIYRDDLFNPLKNLSKKNNRDFYLKFLLLCFL